MKLDVKDAVDIDSWLSHRRMVGALSGRCSAEDAESLRAVRTGKLYRQWQITWHDFCRKRVGMDRSLADGIIRNLEEFGPAFFHIGSVVRISPQTFRRIKSFVTESGLSYEGRIIPLDGAHADHLAAAVNDLRKRTAQTDSAGRLRRAQRSLKNALSNLETVTTMEMDLLERQALQATFQHAMEKLGRLSCGK